MRVAPEIVLTSEEQAELTRLVQSKRASVRLTQRARIVLLAAKGMQNKDIAAELDVGRVQVARWRERYQQLRIAGIERDLPRGAPSAAVDVSRLVHMTTRSKPGAANSWSTRTMAAALGISPASVSRHWCAHGLRPHVVPGFNSSRGAKLVEALEDIVGLYMSPGANLLVLCCDETSQFQTPEPRQPVKMGRATTMMRDYWRHGTATLVGALSLLNEQVGVVGQEEQPQIEWLRFLGRIDREIPENKTLYVLADAHVASYHPAAQKWFASHARFNAHFSPVSTPWLRSVKRFCGDVNDKGLRRSGFISLPNLIASIEEHVAQPAANPGPFIWTRNTRVARQKAIRVADDPIGAKKSDAPSAGKTGLKSKDGAQPRVSGPGHSLRDNVINLKRDRILLEAAKLFFERGYLGTSVDAIAERLGATKPFVYYHFSSKVDILIEICEKSIRDALAAADSAISARGSPSVRLEQFLREFTMVALQQHQLVAIYFREEINLPKEAADRLNQMRKSIDQGLSALLSEGIKTGDFQIEDPGIGSLVIAGMSSYAFAWYREHGRLDQQEVTDRIVNMALKLVSASPHHRPAYRIHSVTGA